MGDFRALGVAGEIRLGKTPRMQRNGAFYNNGVTVQVSVTGSYDQPRRELQNEVQSQLDSRSPALDYVLIC